MAKDGKKVAIVGGLGAIILGVVLLTRKAEAVPPEPPLPGLANIYGKVTDAETGQELSGVSVSLWDTTGAELLDSTSTNGSGDYALKNILPGNYMAQFSKEGYETATR